MKHVIKARRLRIIEQILIVLFFAVLVPMVISGFIINNINQQSMRAQMRDSAVLISKMVSEEADVFALSANTQLNQIEIALSSFKSASARANYINKVLKNSPDYENILVLNSKKNLSQARKQALDKRLIPFFRPLKNGKYIGISFNVEAVRKKFFKSLSDDKRQIYVLTNDGILIASHNYDEKDFSNIKRHLPKKMKTGIPVIFGGIKNQPLVYYKKTDPNVTIIVNTTKEVTQELINVNRAKIILSVLIASLTVLFVVGLYSYYLYINIRQLFKAIIAISKGNYKRRIRLLTHVFTPYEIIFLAFEFNRMAKQVHKFYIKLEKSNLELKKLDEFRSNLIDTVSHEFRTPLTNIQGYTSSLLRQDIQIDEEKKIKSLKTIKRQSERLSRMVEDLLVIPDIEGARIRMNLEPLWLNSVINSAVTLVKKSDKEIENLVNEDFPLIIADNDRLEQVFVNLIENANKYAKEGSKIVLEAEKVGDEFAKIYVKNDCDLIPKEKLDTLFDKFTRIDDKTTRTTRGTGLGLFIVKGLVEAMNGEIKLYSTEESGFIVEIKLPFYIPKEEDLINE